MSLLIQTNLHTEENNNNESFYLHIARGRDIYLFDHIEVHIVKIASEGLENQVQLTRASVRWELLMPLFV